MNNFCAIFLETTLGSVQVFKVLHMTFLDMFKTEMSMLGYTYNLLNASGNMDLQRKPSSSVSPRPSSQAPAIAINR